MSILDKYRILPTSIHSFDYNDDTVYLRPLSGESRYQMMKNSHKEGYLQEQMDNYIIECLIDEAGNPLMKKNDITIARELDIRFKVFLFDKISEISGLNVGDKEEKKD